MLLAMNEYNKCCFAKHAEKGKKYYCRGCRKRVILKKGKKKMRFHFAHQNQITVRSLVKENQKKDLQLKECFMDWLGQSVEPVFLKPICRGCGKGLIFCWRI
ncbi:competence protein CoiA [Enterococcus faecium]|nr:competence protein CoiA [Enterococcus faecium]